MPGLKLSASALFDFTGADAIVHADKHNAL
jgi:hypothetical protein